MFEKKDLVDENKIKFLTFNATHQEIFRQLQHCVVVIWQFSQTLSKESNSFGQLRFEFFFLREKQNGGNEI
jgi:hypothetical protein